MAWADKSKYFTAAALMLLVVSILCFARTYLDKVNYGNNDEIRQEASSTNAAAGQAIDKLKTQQGKGPGYDAIIEEEFELFKYRNVIPLLQQTILSALPNEKSNPTQKALYEAFTEGDIETILKIPRKERKQIFITSMSVYFTNDVATAKFGGGAVKKSRRKRRGRDYDGEVPMMFGPGMGMGMGMGQEFMPPGYGGKTRYTPRRSKKSRKKKDKNKQEEVEKRTGFVVTITGYSPYRTIGELLDPAGVENNPNKWGVITQLLHLDDIIDGNSPFKLYKKRDIEQFRLETDEVDMSSAKMPDGIGIEFEKTRNGERGISVERVLIDPMTKEVISRVAELDEDGNKKVDYVTGDVVYNINDHWFTLDMKFLWKDAPVIELEEEK
jgi:hypothetical protein